jgi:hypothetical protein
LIYTPKPNFTRLKKWHSMDNIRIFKKTVFSYHPLPCRDLISHHLRRRRWCHYTILPKQLIRHSLE